MPLNGITSLYRWGKNIIAHRETKIWLGFSKQLKLYVAILATYNSCNFKLKLKSDNLLKS